MTRPSNEQLRKWISTKKSCGFGDVIAIPRGTLSALLDEADELYKKLAERDKCGSCERARPSYCKSCEKDWQS